jgi:hypothetical protein
MRITARVQKIFDAQVGTSKNGNEWKKQSLLVTQLDNDFKDELMIDMWNDSIKEVEEGTAYDFDIIVKSKEWNGKYYTNVNCKSAYSIHSTNDENPF